jgi:hypothetical protein
MSLDLLFKPGFDAAERVVAEGGSSEDAIATFMEHLELKGGGTWWPVRPSDFDDSAWGAWEAWEFMKIGELPNGAVGAIPTGEWIAWNSKTGAHLVCSAALNARFTAERVCVLNNHGAPTRIVFKDGAAVASDVDFDGLLAQLPPEVLQ